MRKILLALLIAAPCTAWPQLITVSSLSDIQYWNGSGTNRAGLVLEFGDAATPTSIAWGYRWNGPSSAASALFALAGTITGSSAPSPLLGADPRLSVDVSFFPDYGGYFVNSMSYNQVGLSAPWTQNARLIQDNYFGDGTYPTLYSLNSTPGVWANSFTLAEVGMSDLSLSNGMWIGFVQSEGVDPLVFAQPVAAVPEPRTWALLAAGATIVLLVNRKQ